MSKIKSYITRHHVGLVALLLVLTGGTAYAATNVPKSSVGSKQVKDNSLRGKDLKDGGLTGADVADGSVTGSDVADGGVASADLAAGSVDGGKVKDGSIGTADLAPDAVPHVVTSTKITALSPTWLPYATFPGIGSVEFLCDSPTSTGFRFVAVGGGAEVYSFIESQDLSNGQATAQSGKGSSAYIRQLGTASALASGRLIAQTATRDLDVSVLISHAGGCTISGTSTLTEHASAPVPG